MSMYNYTSPGAYAQIQNPDPMMAATHQDAMASRQQGLDALMEQYRAIQENAQMQAAQQHWQGIMAGGGPMNQQMQSQMTGQVGDMATAAQRSQMEAMQRGHAASGGSIYDPSFQAQSGAMDTQRQLQTQGAARDIQMQAALANFQAQNQAAGSLATGAMQQQQLASPIAGRIADTHLNTTWHAPQQQAGQQQPQPGSERWSDRLRNSPSILRSISSPTPQLFAPNSR